jgi:phosphoribosylanthranilate isomerase
MSRVKIKVCGITNKADAEKAIELGADYIGMIFAPTSSRCVKPSGAAQIVATIAGRCKTVGVFQNATAEVIKRTREEVGFDFAQLHGDETLDLIGAATPSIKAISFDGELDMSQVQTFASVCEFLLFDRPKTVQDPRWVMRVMNMNEWEEIKTPFLFAGGLNAFNVGDAVLGLSVSPGFKGIDVASGIESAPGLKDHKKMEEFFMSVREVAANAITR